LGLTVLPKRGGHKLCRSGCCERGTGVDGGVMAVVGHVVIVVTMTGFLMTCWWCVSG
jgi:hypothetical protein